MTHVHQWPILRIHKISRAILSRKRFCSHKTSLPSDFCSILSQTGCGSFSLSSSSPSTTISTSKNHTAFNIHPLHFPCTSFFFVSTFLFSLFLTFSENREGKKKNFRCAFRMERKEENRRSTIFGNEIGKIYSGKKRKTIGKQAKEFFKVYGNNAADVTAQKAYESMVNIDETCFLPFPDCDEVFQG